MSDASTAAPAAWSVFRFQKGRQLSEKVEFELSGDHFSHILAEIAPPHACWTAAVRSSGIDTLTLRADPPAEAGQTPASERPEAASPQLHRIPT
jgi:hypothetical protein